MLQQRELDPGGGDFEILQLDLVATGIDRERSERDDRLLDRIIVHAALTWPTEQSMTTGGDFVRGDRNRDCVVGAASKYFDTHPSTSDGVNAQ